MSKNDKLPESLIKDGVAALKTTPKNNTDIVSKITEIDLNLPIVSAKFGYFFDNSISKFVQYDNVKNSVSAVDFVQIMRDISSDSEMKSKLVEFDPKTERYVLVSRSKIREDKQYIGSARFIFDPFSDEKIKFNQNEYIVNLYEKSDFYKKYESKSIKKLDKHPNIDLLLGNLFPGKDDLEYFLNWFAYILQRRQKTGTAILVYGIQGTGKGVLFEEIIRYAFGIKNTMTLYQQNLDSKFTPRGIENTLFCCCNEVKVDHRKDGNSSSERLKSWITDPFYSIEQKYQDCRDAKNYTNFIFFSNSETPLQIQQTDRRFSVFQSSDISLKERCESDEMTTAELVEKIHVERDSFLQGIMELEVDEEKAKRCKESVQKRAIQKATTSKLENLISDLKNLVNPNTTSTFQSDFIEIANLIIENNYDEERPSKEYIALWNLANKIGFDVKDAPITEIAESLTKTITNDIYDHQGIRASILPFLYQVFVRSDETSQTIFVNLGKFFDAAITVREGEKNLKMRKFLNFSLKVLPF
ncbi:DUF5906 domain-containing protein [Campylobacter ureolyticus]|uniref:primase-helicase family protein n=1 Tax=Campylobacter ureolyticus TaxID=827 RepID=UPI0022B502AA|nr:DUF5906 domain-containing protein [Campylobacter ureolyticus]MCZ6155903.1 DUF5906 domain-containing protein [Campylobacter ureolyticus]